VKALGQFATFCAAKLYFDTEFLTAFLSSVILFYSYFEHAMVLVAFSYQPVV